MPGEHECQNKIKSNYVFQLQLEEETAKREEN